MYLKRKADAFLREWKDSPAHLPLIIRGPRQVGKTETVRHFSQANYKNTVEINFVEKPQFKRVVDEGFAAESIIRLISRMDPSYTYLKSQKGFQGLDEHKYKKLLEDMFAKADPEWDKKPDIKWNFTKFVIDRNGNVVARFEPTADMKKVEDCIKSLL